MVNFKALRSILFILAAVALLSACDGERSPPAPQMQYFAKNTIEIDQSEYFLMIENRHVHGAYYKFSADHGFGYRLMASFYPYPEIVKAYSTHSRGNVTYTYSQAPAELKVFWDAMYERAQEDAAAQGFTVAEPLIAVGHVSVEAYEAQIVELTSRIQALETAELELKATHSEGQIALGAVQAEKDALFKQLNEVTTQRDAYKKFVESLKSSAPNFN